MKMKSLVFSLLFGLGILFTSSIYAQCPMCKANVESTMKGGGKKTGLGLNSGIIALLVMPYAVVSIVGILWYTNSRRGK